PEIVYRHSVLVRVTHWVNVLCLTLLLMSGLKLFNVHPALYWGNYGYRGAPTVLAIDGVLDRETGQPVGITRIGDHNFITTGILGVTYDSDGRPRRGAFPVWATLGSGLALARDWHFLIAWLFAINGTIYLLAGLITGHFRRDLAPAAAQLAPRHIMSDIWNHLRLRRARGEDAKSYNVLQKLSYLAVIFLLLPAMVLTGLTMSPAVTAAFPFLFDLFGGRQSARTIHFITANLLVIFVMVHIVEVMLSGVFNLMRSMITGRYAIRPERAS
ncbi:MAG TPA: cytochrome b/b6 domain-containing protein, partial [Micropepsaceae bacterium]|nr:cytochrome b/b6 domain-containing protein [Micropepsaceae bacterium]